MNKKEEVINTIKEFFANNIKEVKLAGTYNDGENYSDVAIIKKSNGLYIISDLIIYDGEYGMCMGNPEAFTSIEDALGSIDYERTENDGEYFCKPDVENHTVVIYSFGN